MRKPYCSRSGHVPDAGSYLWTRPTITGKVTDEKENRFPMYRIVVRGTSGGAATAADGTYSISIPNNARVLVFSSVNMQIKDQHWQQR